MLQAGDEIVKYLILGSLGAGHFGQVYHVLDRALDVQKAIKVLNVDKPEEYLEKLEEAQILHKCKHKHIVCVNEANVFPVQGVPKVIIDMEYIPNGSLERRIGTSFLSVIDSMKITCGVLYGLGHAHSQDVLHRDIKPANVLLDDVYPKLSDFGLATELGQHVYASGQGYVTHLAPEVFKTHKTTVWSDIYAVGMTFFRIVNNIREWKALIPDDTTRRDKLLSQGKVISSLGYQEYVPPPIRRIINKTCHKDPSHRYQNTIEMCQAIEQLKPRINWIKTSPQQWQGGCCVSGDTYGLSIHSARINKVEVRRNSRIIGQDSVTLSNASECQRYANGYVAMTTLQ